MRNILLVVGVAGPLALFSACSGKDHPGTIGGDTTSGGKSGLPGHGSSGSSGKSTAGSATSEMGAGAGGVGEGGAGSVDPLAPHVVITSPLELDDPNQKGVLSGDTVTVTCEATDSTDPAASKVNASAVSIAILAADGSVLELKGATPTTNLNEYAVDFTLTKVPTGRIGFSCRAEDVDKRASTDTVRTFVDKGPTITFLKPEPGSAHALSEPLDIEFTVDPTPLSAEDDLANVDKVSLLVVGQPIDLAHASDRPGHYRLQVNLADPKLFMPTPSGPIALAISATNQRQPTAVTANQTLQTSIDGTGPNIVISSPVDKDVVGGKVKLAFTVDDAVSGTDRDTIVVTLNKVDYPFDDSNDSWSCVGAQCSFVFDSRAIKDAAVQITVNIVAKDKVGNLSAGTSELLYLDNYPPSIDLDPSNIRTINLTNQCSISFDPVGNAAKNDLDHVVRAGIFRAVVWDQTNHDKEVPIAHFSKTDPKSVHLYLEEDAAKPLLIDTDRDGQCDDVAQVDSTNSLQLGAVGRDGQMLFGQDDLQAPTPSALGCETQPGRETPALCPNQTSDMWQVIDDAFNVIPVIYAASPSPSTDECTGVAWEFGPKLTKNGWVCFATRAVDNAGNVGVSRPIRLCVNNPDHGAEPACWNSSVAPPTCTDGCTPQPRWGNVGVLSK